MSPAIVGVINMQKATSFDDLLQGKSTKAQEAGIGSGVIYQINNNSSYIVIIIMLLMVHHKLKYNYIMVNK